MFQIFNFEVLVKLRKHHVGPDHLSRMESTEFGGILDNELPDALLLKLDIVPHHFMESVAYIMSGQVLKDYTISGQQKLETRSMDY